MISSPSASYLPLLCALAALHTSVLALISCSDDVAPRPHDGNRSGSAGATSSGGSPTNGGALGSGAAGNPSGGGMSGSGDAAGQGTGTAGHSPGGSATGGSATGGSATGGSATGGSGNPAAGSGGSTPSDAKIVLFDGQDLSKWQARDGGGNAPWKITDGALTVVPGTGDIRTRDTFGDIELHVEFMVPSTPSTNGEQDRGNSGIYLMGRYEVQVLDSYMHPLQGMNDCGAIYELRDANVNAALPAESWQTYEITFRAPRFTGQTKSEDARISVIWNGQVAQSDVAVPAPTRLGDAEAPGEAPLRLQDHGNGVRFRNIWVKKL